MQRNPSKNLHDRYDDFPIQAEDSIYHWLPESQGQSFIFHNDNILISRDVLKKKYFEAFNFYFSKPINEILANISLPHVVMYKDYLYYDDESEYLKRYYRIDETAPRLQNLTKFYNNTSEGFSKPNLAVHEQNKIVLKRNNKLHKYYLTKLDNFADIPQTQRNPKPKEEFKILNNLHDEDGISEDIYRHEEHKARAEEERADRAVQDQEEGSVHNSFQKMLEQYENATAKVSFDSTQHNVYDPHNSSGSQPAADTKSAEENNISFEESIELYAKVLNKENHFFEKQGFVDTRATEKTHVANGDTEDQIPHNMSDFALSDASELHLINEMMKHSKEERLVTRLITNVETRGQKAKANVKPNDNIEMPKDKIKAANVQKLNIPKSKSTSTAVYQASKQAESFAKTAKTSIDKSRTPKETDVRTQEYTVERPQKSLERNIIKEPYLQKAISQGAATARNRDAPLLDKSHPSAKTFDIQDKLSPRDMQYPIISIKNVQIKPVEGTIPKDYQPEYRANTMTYDDKSYPGRNQKTVPQLIKKSLGKKFSVPGESKSTIERPVPVTEPNEEIRGLMDKYQRQFEDGSSSTKSKLSLDKVRSVGSKSKGGMDELVDKYQRMGEIYAANDLYTRVAQKTEPKAALQLNRAKTDDLGKNKKLSKESPTRVFETQPNSGRRIVLSPTSPRKEKLLNRFSSNEGLSPRLMTSSGIKLTTQPSTEHSKLMVENYMEEKLMSASAQFKSVKVEKVFSYKRTEMKPPMKSNSLKTEVSVSNNNSTTRRLTAAHTGSGTTSVDKNEVISLPVSPAKKFDLKLNLNKLNQHQETTTENSYGFWSSRSARLPADEESRLKVSGGMITDDRYRYDSSKKDYLLKKNYDPYAVEGKKKERVLKKAGSFRDPNSNQGSKLRETESQRNPVLLKLSTQEAELRSNYGQDMNEIHSAGRLVVKAEQRRPSKK